MSILSILRSESLHPAHKAALRWEDMIKRAFASARASLRENMCCISRMRADFSDASMSSSCSTLCICTRARQSTKGIWLAGLVLRTTQKFVQSHAEPQLDNMTLQTTCF